MSFEEIVFPQCRLITAGNSGDDDRGTGVLDIRETDIVWRGETATCEELRFDFTSISVSAIASYQYPGGEAEEKCLYLQIDTDDEFDTEEDEEKEDECDEGMSIREVHIFFEEKDQLDRAFQAMCDGALRNPDSDVDDEQGGGGFFFDADSMVMSESFDRSVDLKECWFPAGRH